MSCISFSWCFIVVGAEVSEYPFVPPLLNLPSWTRFCLVGVCSYHMFPSFVCVCGRYSPWIFFLDFFCVRGQGYRLEVLIAIPAILLFFLRSFSVLSPFFIFLFDILARNLATP